MDFPITELMDQGACYRRLLDLLHPGGLTCPRCGGGRDRYTVHRRRDGSPVVDYRCKACRRVFNAFTGTACQGTHRTPAPIQRVGETVSGRAGETGHPPRARPGRPRGRTQLFLEPSRDCRALRRRRVRRIPA